MASETIAQTNAAAPGGAKPQPVAIEIPVTVNGASTVAGSDKRQPFSETTQTVLVFGSGAVIRLAAAVGPGQLLFVTNEKSKQEVVCQVVKTKQNGNAAGYVELKFTEATTDFWGIRAPGNGTGSAAPATPSAGAVGAPVNTLEQKLADLKSATPAATQPSSVEIPSPVIPAVAPGVVPAAPVAQANEVQAAPVVPAQPPATPKVPTLSEFLTQGSNGLELKARDTQQVAKNENQKARTAVLTEPKPVNGSAAREPRISNEQENKRSLSVALGVSQCPAPGSASFDLSADLPAEEVKIPAWLEPLARNAAVTESKPAESDAAEIPSIDLHVEEKISAKVPPEPVEHETAPVLASEGRTPNFGTSLGLGSQTEAAASSGKGLKIALAIAALFLAAAAAWYWFMNQAPKVSAGVIGTMPESNPASFPAPSTSSSASEPTPSSTTNSANSRTNLPTAAVSQPTASTASGPLGGSPGTSSSTLNMKTVVPSSDRVNSPADEVAEEPAKKRGLGRVRLAAPKVRRSETAAENGAAEPGLAMNGVSPADSSGLSLLTNKGKGPAAPLPIGGDVKVAKLISSLPPVYPQLARTQRVSGDVTVDAQIDASGRVTATRVISGPALLHEAAMSAVRQWKYQPATLNGVATATHLTVTVQFKLQ
jgi:TonB family protein